MQRTFERPIDAAMLKKVPLFAHCSAASLGSGMREFKESVTHQALPETTTERETVD